MSKFRFIIRPFKLIKRLRREGRDPQAAVTFWTLSSLSSYYLTDIQFLQKSQKAFLSSVPLRPTSVFFKWVSSSLKLRDLEGCSAAKVQEEGSFLFGQEGGGGDVVDACWDQVHLHVAETTSMNSQTHVLWWTEIRTRAESWDFVEKVTTSSLVGQDFLMINI